MLLTTYNIYIYIYYARIDDINNILTIAIPTQEDQEKSPRRRLALLLSSTSHMPRSEGLSTSRHLSRGLCNALEILGKTLKDVEKPSTNGGENHIEVLVCRG